MSFYNIKSWNVVLGPDGINQVPMIFIEPDLAFLDAARKNNQRLSCLFHGTNTPIYFTYDGAPIMGSVNSSCIVPNCRPNFCNKTQYYAITLDIPWRGYPVNNGVVQFFGQH
jgi:hypothetical protein